MSECQTCQMSNVKHSKHVRSIACQMQQMSHVKYNTKTHVICNSKRLQMSTMSSATYQTCQTCQTYNKHDKYKMPNVTHTNTAKCKM